MFYSSTVFMVTANLILVFSLHCRLLHCQDKAAFAQFNLVFLWHMFALCGSIYVYNSYWSGIIILFLSHWNWVWIRICRNAIVWLRVCLWSVQFDITFILRISRYSKHILFWLKNVFFCCNVRLMLMYKYNIFVSNYTA